MERRHGKHPFLERMANNLQALLPFRLFIHSFVLRRFFSFFAIFSARPPHPTPPCFLFLFLSPFLRLFGAVLYFSEGGGGGDDAITGENVKTVPHSKLISIIAGVLHLEGEPVFWTVLCRTPYFLSPFLLFGLESVDVHGLFHSCAAATAVHPPLFSTLSSSTSEFPCDRRC